MKTTTLKINRSFLQSFFRNRIHRFSGYICITVAGVFSTQSFSDQGDNYLNDTAPPSLISAPFDASTIVPADKNEVLVTTPNALTIVRQLIATSQKPPMPKGIPELAKAALGVKDAEDTFFMKIMDASLLPHSVIHDSKILVEMRSRSASQKQSRHFHTGLLAMYEILETDYAALQPDNVRQLVSSLSRVALLKQDCLNMYKDASGEIPDLSNLESIIAYKQHLTEITNNPAKLLAHHYVHLAGILAGGQKLKVRLRAIHPPDELTHYEFGTEAHTNETLYKIIQLVNSVPQLYPDQQEAFIEEVSEAFTLSAAVYRELYLPAH